MTEFKPGDTFMFETRTGWTMGSIISRNGTIVRGLCEEFKGADGFSRKYRNNVTISISEKDPRMVKLQRKINSGA